MAVIAPKGGKYRSKLLLEYFYVAKHLILHFWGAYPSD
jgi:hypothetical protein